MAKSYSVAVGSILEPPGSLLPLVGRLPLVGSVTRLEFRLDFPLDGLRPLDGSSRGLRRLSDRALAAGD